MKLIPLPISVLLSAPLPSPPPPPPGLTRLDDEKTLLDDPVPGLLAVSGEDGDAERPTDKTDDVARSLAHCSTALCVLGLDVC